MRLFLLLLLSVASLALSAQVTSDFNDNSTQGWDNGNNVDDPTIEIGGPAGDTDPYLQIVATGGGGPGSKLAAFNTSGSWTGDLLSAGIIAVRLDAANFGDNDVTVRMVIESGTDRLVTSSSLDLAAGDNTWQGHQFLLGEADLTGTADYTAVMSNVTKVWIFHGGASFPGPGIVATVGVDNVEQLTELSSVRTLGPEVFSLAPIAQPAPSGTAALLLQSDVSGNFQADIFDLTGRKINGISGDALAGGRQTIDLADLRAGNYLVRFTLRGSFGRSVRTQRLIVH